MTTASAVLNEERLVRALRDGDERAFETLVERYGARMQRLARNFCGSDAVAQEVVQETWVVVIRGIARFEGRSSLSTWLLRIVANRAKTGGIRERRSIPLSAVAGAGEYGPAAAAERCVAEGRCAGHWASTERVWEQPEERLLSVESRERLREALEGLPESQRRAVALRDVQGLDTMEAAAAMGITETHVRVLLHRGRAGLRQTLDDYVASAA